MQARVLSHHGRQAWVIDEHHMRHQCVFKGRDILPVANDTVTIDLAESPPVIVSIHPRRNQLIRSEAHRTKGLAANVDQALVVVSGAPPFSDEILARMICACAAEDIPGIVALNKIDLQAAAQTARQQLLPFHQAFTLLGWQVIEVSAIADQPQGLSELHAALIGKTTVVMGQSGMGKSSLLNALIPGINLQTREISEALQTGKHTTTAGVMVQMPGAEGWLIDTPGFQLYGLHHLSESEMALGFPEWRHGQDHHGRCKYFNCRHIEEPGCTVQMLAQQQEISARRLMIWQALISPASSRSRPRTP
jgi:ribosome biogenesis GTPase / thiamine phosphate phosphatase